MAEGIQDIHYLEVGMITVDIEDPLEGGSGG